MFPFLDHYYLQSLKKKKRKKQCLSPSFTHLVVGFVLHVLAVHLHHPVPGPQAAVISRRTGLHLADKLAAFVALTVQVEAIAAISFGEETEPGSQLGLHSPRQAGQEKKCICTVHTKKTKKLANVSQENEQVFAAPSLLMPGRAELFIDRTMLIVQHAARSANNPDSTQ